MVELHVLVLVEPDLGFDLPDLCMAEGGEAIARRWLRESERTGKGVLLLIENGRNKEGRRIRRRRRRRGGRSTFDKRFKCFHQLPIQRIC
jgi:hypothetical protein